MIVTEEIPPRVKAFLDECGLSEVYFEAVSDLDSSDLVIVGSMEIDKAIPFTREDFMKIANEPTGEETIDAFHVAIKDKITGSASAVTRTQFAFWLIVEDEGGYHCLAVGIARKDTQAKA